MSVKKKAVVSKPAKPAKVKHQPAPILPHLYPHTIIRLRDAAPYFGYKHSQFEAKIKAGDLPRPIPLSHQR